MRPAVQDLVRLALDGAYVFHGSPTSFDELRPSHTTRSYRDKRTGEIRVRYDGVSAHASHVHVWCTAHALMYRMMIDCQTHIN